MSREERSTRLWGTNSLSQTDGRTVGTIVGVPGCRHSSGAYSRQYHRSSRGQTEPLAALVAVAAICLVFTSYAGLTTDVTSNVGSERSPVDATLGSVWNEISEDGVFDAETTSITEGVETTTIPEGYHVTVSVTVVDEDGRITEVDSTQFRPDGESLETRLEPPETAHTSSRPVPVRVVEGDVRPGRLNVVVWK